MTTTSETRDEPVVGATQKVQFIEAMGHVPTPVAIATTLEAGMPHGTTVSAFFSLSVEPPKFLLSLDQNSKLLEVVNRTRSIGLNVLDSAQGGLARRFASKLADRFDETPWSVESGVPRLDGAAVWLSGKVDRIVAAGDHFLVLVDATAVSARRDADPLTYRLRQLGTHRPVS
ncbi:flavin reductase family protein [Microbacterium album]|uniref:Oxidoreductase n=1 Tax=Microbacterium album TaxID=2053191 RepID=A0A917IES7_9MICO|nr:flavin reductase family protein [Microbacterium album]GGH42589.1 oxidoreductase [Microbacterium album]